MTEHQNEHRNEHRSEEVSSGNSSAEQRELEAVQRELEQARGQLTDLEGLLGELPRIFESKFQERLQPVLEQQRLIAEENHELLEKVRHVLGSGAPPEGRPALPEGRSAGPPEPPIAPGSPSTPNGAAPSAPDASATTPRHPVGSFLAQERKKTVPSPGESVETQEEGGSESAINVRHWVLPRWAPEGLSMQRLRRLAGLTGLTVLSAGVVVLVAAPVVVRQQQPPPVPLASKPVAAPSGSNDQVVFASRDESWLEVHDADGATLFSGKLRGLLRLPLGRGLKVRSGRPDLVTVRVDQGPARKLGRINQVNWQTIRPPKG